MAEPAEESVRVPGLEDGSAASIPPPKQFRKATPTAAAGQAVGAAVGGDDEAVVAPVDTPVAKGNDGHDRDGDEDGALEPSKDYDAMLRDINSNELAAADYDDRDKDPDEGSEPNELQMTDSGRIEELKRQIEATAIEEYAARFEAQAASSTLVIGSFSVKEAEAVERKLREERVALQQLQLETYRRQHEDIADREQRAKANVQRVFDRRKHETNTQKIVISQRAKMAHGELSKAFNRAESQLKDVLSKRKAEITSLYGDLATASSQYGGVKGRRWKIDWEGAPLPVQLKLNCARALKDKLPKGRYVVMASLYDRLGGHVLRWSRLKGQEWGSTTLPVTHTAQFDDVEMRIDQSVFTVCPARHHITPGMIFVFELFLLRGEHAPIDQVMGWGAFPVTDASFDVISGKFKVPLLRGEMDPRINTYEKYEEIYAQDIDSWLCNMYFEVIRMPRHVAGQKEYEVELQFSSRLLGFPDRMDGTEEQKKALDLTTSGVGQDKPVESEWMEEQAGLFAKLHKTELALEEKMARGRDHRPVTAAAILDQHSYSIKLPFSARSRRRAKEKASFMWQHLKGEIGPTQWKSREFWGLVALTLVCMYVRLYIHYVGQWLYLWAVGIPISVFDFDTYTVTLLYPWNTESMTSVIEVGLVVIGPLSVYSVFGLLILMGLGARKAIGSLRDFASRLVMGFGVATLMDPILVAAVDLVLSRHKLAADRPVADMAKLYWHFTYADNSGLMGIILVVFLYFFCAYITLATMYIYFTTLHMNGRMIDAYKRLQGKENDFFVPLDLELSILELKHILEKAERWRGEKGQRRKVMIVDYTCDVEKTVDEEGKGATGVGVSKQVKGAKGEQQDREVTTQITIYTTYLDGSREQHRQFLRLPEGAIIEVFGSVESLGLKTGALSRLLDMRQQGHDQSLGESMSILSKSRGSVIDKSTVSLAIKE